MVLISEILFRPGQQGWRHFVFSVVLVRGVELLPEVHHGIAKAHDDSLRPRFFAVPRDQLIDLPLRFLVVEESGRAGVSPVELFLVHARYLVRNDVGVY